MPTHKQIQQFQQQHERLQVQYEILLGEYQKLKQDSQIIWAHCRRTRQNLVIKAKTEHTGLSTRGC